MQLSGALGADVSRSVAVLDEELCGELQGGRRAGRDVVDGAGDESPATVGRGGEEGTGSCRRRRGRDRQR